MTALPQGWSATTLGAVADWGSGGTPSRGNSEYYGGAIPWIKTGELGGRYVTETEECLTKEGIENSSAKVFPSGSIAIAMYGATIGKTSILAIDAATNQACAVGKPNIEVVSRDFLYHFICSQKENFVDAGKGGAQPNISQGVIKGWGIPLAPLPEQTRIADKLDAVLARVDAARGCLDRVPALLKRFRQSVLAAAVSGELTQEWRGGKEAEWKYLRATDVCGKVQSGGTPKEGFVESGVPFLKVYNIVGQKVSFDYRPQYITAKIHSGSMAKSIVKPGDVLMNIVGPPLGKVAVVPDAYVEWNINQAITLFRPSDLISTGWLYCVLCGGKNIEEIVHETKGMVGQQNISLSQCRNFVFPVPSTEEQTEIIRRVEVLFALADNVQAQYETARARVDKLTRALLTKAFRGELVPQDPNDEPASVLLERLRANKANAPTAMKQGRGAPATVRKGRKSC